MQLLLQVLFTSTRAARQCCEKLHNTSKMGKIMTVIVDSMGMLMSFHAWVLKNGVRPAKFCGSNLCNSL